ncbi:MAG: trypsin-like peptidase domain-containing protein [Alphaproteobacteria bacterium]|nr:trypsin-like peptidase domain-containing protein [Alphaproteobacteria bacterium]
MMLHSDSVDVNALLQAILRDIKRASATGGISEALSASPEAFTVKLTGVDAAFTREITGSGFIIDKNQEDGKTQKDGKTTYVIATAAHVANGIQQRGQITTADGITHAVTNIVKPKADADGTVTDVAFVSFTVASGGPDYSIIKLTTAEVGDKIVVTGFTKDTDGAYTQSTGSIVATDEKSLSKENYTGQTIVSNARVKAGYSGSANFEQIGGVWYANGLTSLRVQTKSGDEFSGAVSTRDIAALYHELTGDAVAVKTSKQIAAETASNSSLIALTTMMGDPQFSKPDAQVSSVINTNALVESIYAAIIAASPSA